MKAAIRITSRTPEGKLESKVVDRLGSTSLEFPYDGPMAALKAIKVFERRPAFQGKHLNVVKLHRGQVVSG